ncbi:UNVERIFIED_CONTAM: hypothetical protein FKN15_028181 [Acipenser sinensis]
MLPLGHLIRQHSVMFHSYADDNQLYLKLDPGSPSAMVRLSACFQDIEAWMSAHFLQLITSKSELLLVESKTQESQHSCPEPQKQSAAVFPHSTKPWCTS